MILAVLKETKPKEGRVALTPEGAGAFVAAGHSVLIQKSAGVSSGFADKDYAARGARIVASVKTLLSHADLVLKVKEPTLSELDGMRAGQMLFCYLHLAAFPQLLKKILKKKMIALGYETLQLDDGRLPLLAPMSEIAGKLATQNGAHYLRADQGGRGVLLGGTEKVEPATVVILGGGVVGANAARIAIGMGAKTHVLDISSACLQALKNRYGGQCVTDESTRERIEALVPQADLLIGAVLIPGAKAPKLVTKKCIQSMKKGSVVVDVAVDQGGCIETSQPTTHEKPIVVRYGVLHYGVTNIPAAVPVTATLALTRETLPYILLLADLGLEGAIRKAPELRHAVNCSLGSIVHPALRQPIR